jgi:hypothetical protein
MSEARIDRFELRLGAFGDPLRHVEQMLIRIVRPRLRRTRLRRVWFHLIQNTFLIFGSRSRTATIDAADPDGSTAFAAPVVAPNGNRCPAATLKVEASRLLQLSESPLRNAGPER